MDPRPHAPEAPADAEAPRPLAAPPAPRQLPRVLECAVPSTAPPDGCQTPGAQAGRPGAPQPEQPTFAKLLAKNVSLVNGTLSWYSEQGLAGVILSPDLSYDERSHELVVAEAGVYFVFLRMQLWRVMRAGPPSQGEVSLTLQLQPPSTEATDLALTVTVPRISSSKDLGSKPAGGFWGHLVDLQGGQRLSVRLSALLQGGAEAHRAWQLAPHAVFGLFRVTGDVPGELLV
ncbi:tumor necrosis factor ligand superfamily member 9 [Dipodomys spectabilis]|uniref:tumor necrosis factor ligand superfamily member 9 n=1 Tax=Dipodomys spectabilis TaxID=105255 RepID=UPI001C548CC0|nr:tumor necrosis factor ligand superfamily member 9 [Dipodomys spectabilis]